MSFNRVNLPKCIDISHHCNEASVSTETHKPEYWNYNEGLQLYYKPNKHSMCKFKLYPFLCQHNHVWMFRTQVTSKVEVRGRLILEEDVTLDHPEAATGAKARLFEEKIL